MHLNAVFMALVVTNLQTYLKYVMKLGADKMLFGFTGIASLYLGSRLIVLPIYLSRS